MKPVYLLSYRLGFGQFVHLLRCQNRLRIKQTGKWVLFGTLLVLGAAAAAVFFWQKKMAQVARISVWVLPGLTAFLLACLSLWLHSFFLLRRKFRQGGWKDGLVQLRLYEDFFSVHMPVLAFNAAYRDVKAMRRSEKETQIVLENKSCFLIPNKVLEEPVVVFLAQKTSRSHPEK